MKPHNSSNAQIEKQNIPTIGSPYINYMEIEVKVSEPYKAQTITNIKSCFNNDCCFDVTSKDNDLTPLLQPVLA